jgi:hypothetical protein
MKKKYCSFVLLYCQSLHIFFLHLVLIVYKTARYTASIPDFGMESLNKMKVSLDNKILGFLLAQGYKTQGEPFNLNEKFINDTIV